MSETENGGGELTAALEQIEALKTRVGDLEAHSGALELAAALGTLAALQIRTEKALTEFTEALRTLGGEVRDTHDMSRMARGEVANLGQIFAARAERRADSRVSH